MRRLAVPAIALSLAALIPFVALPAIPGALGATRPNPKVVVIAGPVGPSHNAHYQSDADAIAATARKYTSNVIEIKSPHATWSRVKPALQGASIVVYLGHGNGWPSMYAPYQPYTKDGFGLDPETGANGDTHIYIGEYYIARDVKLAPNAVVLFHHLCYASGNTEPGLAVGPLSSSKLRPDNYAAGFISAGARAVIADVAHPHTAYIDWLFTKSMPIETLFYTYPTYHGHPILMDSIRHQGFKEILDPDYATSGFYRSIVYSRSLTTTATTGTWYAPTNTTPTALVVPGAAQATTAVPWFADAALTPDPETGAPAGTLAVGTTVRLTAAAPALPDGSKVYAFTTLDGATSGYLKGTGLAPRDSTAPRLWTFDAPISPASIDGTFPFEVGFRVSEVVDARLTVKNGAGATVKTIAMTDDLATMSWDLVGADGHVVPNGTYSWSFRAADRWGNTPITRTGTVTLDTTDPVSTAAVSAGTLGGSGWYITPASVAISATDTGSGVTSRTYAIDGGASHTVSGLVAVATSGTHKVTYFATDRAGNQEAAHTLTVKVDVTKPVTTPTVTGLAGSNGWWTGPASVTLNAVDAHSGVAKLVAAVDGGPTAPVTGPFAFSTEGTHTISYAATDRAGNVEATRTTTVRIDATKPTTDLATVAGTVGVDGWVVTPATVSFHGADALSGVAGFRTVLDGGAANLAAASLTVATSGQHTLTYATVDRAGNVGPSRTISFKVDRTAPTSSVALGGTQGDPAFFRTDVTVTPTSVDADSGVARLEAAVDGAAFAPVTGPILVKTDGRHTVTFRAKDRAGNVEATKSSSFTIDRTPPSLGPSPAPTASPATFSPNGDGLADTVGIRHQLSEPAVVTARVVDAGGTLVRSFATPAQGPGAVVWDGRRTDGTFAPRGVYTVSLTARDRAGNVSGSLTTSVALYPDFVGGTRSTGIFFPQDGDAVAKTVTIGFTLRAAATVRLEVLDATGKVVRTIVASKAAGAAQVSWNGRTNAGTYAPQGKYVLRVTASSGTLHETKQFGVTAAAFAITPSATVARRGQTLTVTAVSAEPLSTTPRLVVHQPGLAAYGYTMCHVSGSTWRVTFTVHSGSTGTVGLAVVARDRSSAVQSSVVWIPLR
ncbi:MAG: OmpL47-type beta-barrel domain-containing protein [Chloroflexota bacterium]